MGTTQSNSKIKPIKGNYYWVKPYSTKEFEPAKCDEYYSSSVKLYFFFTDGGRMEVDRVFDIQPLNYEAPKN